MKKVISITISLCLVFGAIIPVYAEAWTSSEAQSVTSDVRSIKTYLQSFVDSWTTFFETGQGTISTLLTFQDLMRDIVAMGDWLAPMFDYAGGLRPEGILSIWDNLTNSLSQLTVISSYTGQIPTTNNYLNQLLKILGNGRTYQNGNIGSWSVNDVLQNAHMDLWGGAASSVNPNTWYNIPIITYHSQPYLNNNVRWVDGTPIGNVVKALQLIASNQAYEYYYNYTDTLTHFNDQLSTWDSQGETLNQVTFTPDSAIQGLYRYLAFTQRDVARLTYVFASDEEIATREKARENQDAVLDNFIDPEGEGAVNDANFGDIANASGSIKDNFNTGVNPTGIFSIFSTDDKATPWFSNETKNELMPQTRAEYSTPLLDAYYDEIMGVFDNAR